jgi:hypothetical protein
MNTDLRKIKRQIIFIGVCLIVWAVGNVSLASAAPAENVTLASFDSTNHEKGVLLSWTTATELDTMGFQIERESEGELVLFPNGSDVVAAVGSPTLGAQYEFLDETAVSPQTYTYHLLEQTLNGSITEISSTTITLIEDAEQIQLVAPPTDVPRATNPPRATNTAVSPTATFTFTPMPTEESSQQSAISSQPTATATQSPIPNPQTPISNPPSQEVALVNTDINDEVVQDEPALPPIQTTPENGYPAPPTPVQPVTDEAYPEGTPVPPTPLPPTAYPASIESGSDPTPTTVSIIGETAADGNEEEPVVAPPENAGSGRIYLWGGFLMGILIFITAVIGAIILFTRRNS